MPTARVAWLIVVGGGNGCVAPGPRELPGGRWSAADTSALRWIDAGLLFTTRAALTGGAELRLITPANGGTARVIYRARHRLDLIGMADP